MSVSQIKQLLQQMADTTHAAQLQRFFKTGPGGYGYGDRFLGIRVPKLRNVAKTYQTIGLSQVTALLNTDVHEHRMVALLILTYRYPRANEAECERIYRFYLDNTRWINNWDLVDVTAPHIVGAWLLERDKSPLYQLAESDSLWERRIAIMATFYFIRRDRFNHTLKLADRLIADTHDLIHKAVGWMLREVGKRDQQLLEEFLATRYARMPRTMLRYAIERLPESRRQAYLKGRI